MTSEPDVPAGESLQGRARKRLFLAWTIFVVALAVPCVLFLTWPRPAFQARDITGVDWGRGFELHDPDGHVRSLADFRGKVVLLFFGFTQCPEVCPTALVRANDVITRLGPDGSRVAVVFVTLDPERDTPEIMKAYTQAFNPNFVGLRDTPERTAAVARDWHIFYQRVPNGSSYTLDHTAITYAIDPAGRLRLAIGHDKPAGMVASDVQRLLKETKT